MAALFARVCVFGLAILAAVFYAEPLITHGWNEGSYRLRDAGLGHALWALGAVFLVFVSLSPSRGAEKKADADSPPPKRET